MVLSVKQPITVCQLHQGLRLVAALSLLFVDGAEYVYADENVHTSSGLLIQSSCKTTENKKSTHKPQETSKMSSPKEKYRATHTITPPRTPTATKSSAHMLFAEIQDIHTSLSALPNLAPGGQVDELLTRLVGLCITPQSADFVSNLFSIRGVNKLCEELRPLCAVAEGHLEKYWAERIIKEAEQQNTGTSLCIHTWENILTYFK
jgi:hypothetical protein